MRDPAPTKARLILAICGVAVVVAVVGAFALGSKKPAADSSADASGASPSPAPASSDSPAAASPPVAAASPGAPAASPAVDETPEAFAGRYYALYEKADGLAIAKLLDRASRDSLLAGNKAQRLVHDLEDKLLANALTPMIEGERDVLSSFAVTDVQRTPGGAVAHARAQPRGARVALELVVEDGHWRAHLDPGHSICGVVQDR